MLLYANDQIILQESENALQISVHKLTQIAVEYKLKVSTQKTKTVALHGKYPIRTKILIYNETIEQVSYFNYLGCDATYEINNDIQNKLNKCRQIYGIIVKTLKGKARKEMQIKFYKMMGVPTLLYGSEIWIFKINLINVDKYMAL
jgi:hypothetical protein